MTELPADLLKQHKGISYPGITTCFICHDNQGSIFMAKRSQNARDEQGTWDVGGGGLDWGLTAEANVIKEVEEEYAASPVSVQFLGYRDVFREMPDASKTHWLALDFVVHVNRDDVKINEPHKFDDSGWFAIDSLPSPLHSQNINMLNKHRDALQSILFS